MRVDSLASLRYRDFRLLWFGQLVSMSGTQMQRVAIAWHIYLLTHDPIALGLIGVFRVLPVLIFSLIGGVVADAQDRRRVLLLTQTAMMLSAALLAVITFMGNVSAPVIYVLVSLTAVAGSFDGPARQSLVPNVVPREHVANAFSLNSIMGEVARVVGASVGGLVIASLGGVGSVYALNAFSYLAIIGAVLMMRPVPRVKLERKTLSLQAVFDGFRYMRQSPVIMGAMLMDFFATFFGSASTLLPIIASDVLHVGAEGYGILSAAPSIGSILSGALMTMRPHFRRPGRIMLAAVALYGVATILFGLSNIYVLSLFFFAFTGAGDTISMILRQTIRQLSTPDSLRGRMTSINMIFAMGGPQFGDMEAGIAAQLFGAPIAVISGGVGCILAVLLMIRLAPALRDFDGTTLQQSQPQAPGAPVAAATD
jgi:MFS family permease